MKKFTLLFISLFISVASFAQETAGLYQTVVFDFVQNVWGIPNYTSSFTSVKEAKEYTYGDWTIKIVPELNKNKGGFYYDDKQPNYPGKNCLYLPYKGSKIVLPKFDFPVDKIVLVGHPEATAYPNVEMSVCVDGKEVSNRSKGTTGTYTYEIESGYQDAGNIYEMVIASSSTTSIMYITAIKVYPATNKLEAPVFDMPSGVYTGPIDITMTSPTTEIEGVEDVIYYYTTDGMEPEEESEETEDGKITISKSCTLKAVVSLTYNEDEYMSESTSAEYIISESATATKATEIESGRYFIAADGRIATQFEKRDFIATKEIDEIAEEKITDAEYYLFSLEATSDGFFIKDGIGNYISIDAAEPHLISTNTEKPFFAWNINIEDGFAKISINNVFLVYDAEKSFFTKSEGINDQTVFPVLYQYTERVQEEEGEGNEGGEDDSTDTPEEGEGNEGGEDDSTDTPEEGEGNEGDEGDSTDTPEEGEGNEGGEGDNTDTPEEGDDNEDGEGDNTDTPEEGDDNEDGEGDSTDTPEEGEGNEGGEDDSTDTPEEGEGNEGGEGDSTDTPEEGEGNEGGEDDSTDTPEEGEGNEGGEGDSTDTPEEGEGGEDDSTDTPEEGEGNEGGEGDSTDTPEEGEGNEGGEGDVEEGIEEIAATSNAIIYDITGRRISEITKPGIYIINGKKVIKRTV